MKIQLRAEATENSFQNLRDQSQVSSGQVSEVNPVNLKGGCLSYCTEVNKLMGFEMPLPKCSTERTETPVE